MNLQELAMGEGKYAQDVAEGLTQLGGCMALLVLLEQALEQQRNQDSMMAMPMVTSRHLLDQHCCMQALDQVPLA